MSEQSKHTCQVFHFDLYGERENKYQFLQENTLQTIQWQQLNPQAPQFFFVPKDFSLQEEYEKGFKIDELMKVCNSGIQTKRDNFVYQYIQNDIETIINTLKNKSAEECRNILNIGDDGIAWKVDWAQRDIKQNKGQFAQVLYRPFDQRWTYYTGKSSGFMARPRMPESLHLLKENIALLAVRNTRRDMCNNYFVASTLVDKDGISSFDNCRFFPLYLYPEDDSLETARRANLDEKIWQQINAAIGRETTPEQVFDYIYGVLHSPSYRTKYKEFLKVDFPRIPYPASAQEFERYSAFGNRLRQLHLMHNLPAPQVTFPESGSMEADKAEYRQGRVYINATQYFDGVPESAWNFYIGGYQPAQKWLKDRRGRTLAFEDVRHYQQIIYVLQETERIMGEIDNQQ